MKVYNIYNRSNKINDIRVLPSICQSNEYALIFSFLWLIKKGAWRFAIVMWTIVSLIAYTAVRYGVAAEFILVPAHFLIGFLSGHILTMSCWLENYGLVDIICARDEDEAMLIFMKRITSVIYE